MNPRETGYDVLWETFPADVLTRNGRRDYEAVTDVHDTRRLYVTATLQELRAELAKGPLGRDWQGLSILKTVDEYIVQIEEFLESTAPEGT